jgi:hypothetical protein
MKNMYESSETFEAYAVIDYCYYCLRDLTAKLGFPKSPIDRLVDEATGASKTETYSAAMSAIDMLEEVIKAKQVIDADYSADIEAIKVIKEIADRCKSNN